MLMKIHIYLKIIFFFLVCMYGSSTCFAITGLPISSMNCNDLIEKTNAVLSLAGKKIRCSDPRFKEIGQRGKTFYCYVGKQDIYRPANGLILLHETPTGETRDIFITFEMNDKIKFLETAFVFSSVMLVCGLTKDEAVHLVNSLNHAKHANDTMPYGYIWSHKLNRYYVLAGEKNEIVDGAFSFMLIACRDLSK